MSLAWLILAAERGDATTTQRELDRLGSLQIEEMHAELQGFYWASRVSDLRWRGQYEEAYELVSQALATIDGRETWLHMAPVATAAIEMVADAVAAGLHEPQWIDRAAEWHARFGEFSGPAQRHERLHATATADLARSRGHNDPGLWRQAMQEAAANPYWLAKSQWRLAESLVALDPADSEALSLLVEVERVATGLRAQPLLAAAQITRENTPT